ncbi:MAG: hypothetical protein QM648_11110 [Solirubrobacterales bacterium]
MPEVQSPQIELPRVIGLLGDQLELAYTRAEREARFAETPAARPRRSRRKGFAIVCAVAGLIAAIICLAGIGIRDKTAGVSEALGNVASRIEVAPQPKPSQFLYTRTRSTYAQYERPGLDYHGHPHKGFVAIRPHFQTSWLSVTHNGKLIMQGGHPTYPTTADAAVGKPFYESLDWFQRAQRNPKTRHGTSKIWWKLAHWNEARGMGLGVSFPESFDAERGTMISNDRLLIGGEMLTRKQIASYPRDPQKIYRRARSEFERQARAEQKFQAKLRPANRIQPGENPDVEESVWGALSQSSGDLPASQELRSAVVRALAYLPGVESKGETTDPRGRTGELFTWDHKGKRYSVIFDAKTSVVLSAESVVVDPSQLEFVAFRHLPAGTKLSTYEVLEQKTIDHLPRRK